jgi:hypothetical protein
MGEDSPLLSLRALYEPQDYVERCALRSGLQVQEKSFMRSSNPSQWSDLPGLHQLDLKTLMIHSLLQTVFSSLIFLDCRGVLRVPPLWVEVKTPFEALPPHLLLDGLSSSRALLSCEPLPASW